jgi:hypothetical protein
LYKDSLHFRSMATFCQGSTNVNVINLYKNNIHFSCSVDPP